jgi:cell division protein FtsI (penicillin-binding protein 3)
MLRPYLVNQVQQNGLDIKSFLPETQVDEIASASTITQLKNCLEGVCHEEGGTAFELFKNSPYRVAGKTGTAKVANGNKGYQDAIYQSSFAGYFPADNPQYSCIVVIRNKPHAKKYYGAAIAGPVFKEVSDKLYTLNVKARPTLIAKNTAKDSATFVFAGPVTEIKQVMKGLNMTYVDSAKQASWGKVYAMNSKPILRGQAFEDQSMPDVRGMGLKDALYVLETRQLKVMVKGAGKVWLQSLPPGTPLVKNQPVAIELN